MTSERGRGRVPPAPTESCAPIREGVRMSRRSCLVPRPESAVSGEAGRSDGRQPRRLEDRFMLTTAARVLVRTNSRPARAAPMRDGELPVRVGLGFGSRANMCRTSGLLAASGGRAAAGGPRRRSRRGGLVFDGAACRGCGRRRRGRGGGLRRGCPLRGLLGFSGEGAARGARPTRARGRDGPTIGCRETCAGARFTSADCTRRLAREVFLKVIRLAEVGGTVSWRFCRRSSRLPMP